MENVAIGGQHSRYGVPPAPPPAWVAWSRLHAPRAVRPTPEARPITLLRYTFLLFVFSIPLEVVGSTLSGVGTLSKLIGYLFIMVTVLQPRVCYRRPPVALWYFAGYLGVMMVLGALEGPDYRREVATRTVSIAQLLILFWVSSSLMSAPKMARAVFRWLSVAIVFVALLQLSGIAGSVYMESGRITAFGQDPNTVGSGYAIGIVTLIGLNYGGVKLPRWVAILSWGAMAIVGMALVQTGSRGAMTALAAGVLPFIFSGGTVWSRVRNTLAVIVALAMFSLMTLRSEESVRRWKLSVEGGSMAGREHIYPAAWEMFVERPIIGWGPYINYHELGARTNSYEGIKDTHNLALWVLTETGLVGALPFFAGIWVCGRGAWRRRDGSLGMLPVALFLAVMVVNMSLTWITHKQTWLILGLAAATESVRTGARSRRGPGFRKERQSPVGDSDDRCAIEIGSTV